MGEDTRLSEALTEVLITSYEIESCRPFFFTRGRHGPRKPAGSIRGCGRSRAARRLRPPISPRSRSSDRAARNLPPLTLIDAGMFVNNPTLCAYAEAVSMHNRPVDVPSSDVLPGSSKQSERPVEVRRRACETRRSQLNTSFSRWEPVS